MFAALLAALVNESSAVPGAAVQSLGELDAKEAAPEVSRLLKDDNQDVRERARAVLAGLKKGP